MRIYFIAMVIAAFLQYAPHFSYAQEVRAVSFNIEMGWKSGAQLSTVRSILRFVGDADLWAFSEVTKGTEDDLAAALGDDYVAVLGADNGADYLAIVYNASKYEVLRRKDVRLRNASSRQRRPLALLLRHKNSGQEFWFVSAHLFRSDDTRRENEARDLNRWARGLSRPAIAMGDFNFDYSVRNRRFGNFAVNRLRAGGVWEWVQPSQFRPSHCGSHRSILDFAFVSGDAQNWESNSQIIPTWCINNKRRPDHRPIELNFEIP